MELISTMNFNSGIVMATKIFSPIKEKNNIIVILIKLLAIISVANSFFGFSKSLEIKVPLELLSCVIWSTSFCDKENKATPVPESNAEQNNKRSIPKTPNARLVSIAYKNGKLGSGSKLIKIS